VEGQLAGRSGTPGKFADTAVPKMLNLLKELGAPAHGLTAKFSGGGNMFGGSGPLQIGDANAEAVAQALKNVSIRAAGQDVGGTKGRTPYVKNASQPEHGVSGVIGLSGKTRGTVVLGLSREATLNAAEALLEERPPEINGEVTDAVGELANIIAGGAKAQLEHLQLSVSLPTVITGKHHCVEFPSKVTPIRIPFESEWGPITVEIGLSEQPT